MVSFNKILCVLTNTQKRTFPWTKIEQNRQKTYYFPNYFHILPLEED